MAASERGGHFNELATFTCTTVCGCGALRAGRQILSGSNASRRLSPASWRPTGPSNQPRGWESDRRQKQRVLAYLQRGDESGPDYRLPARSLWRAAITLVIALARPRTALARPMHAGIHGCGPASHHHCHAKSFRHFRTSGTSCKCITYMVGDIRFSSNHLLGWGVCPWTQTLFKDIDSNHSATLKLLK